MNKTHILVVDDDLAISRLVCANLKARGYEVTAAMDGEEALKAMERDLIDLVVLDIMMPRLDGVEVCRRLRQWSNVPIIILSARGDEKSKVQCLDLGADDYLTKPFGIAELLARVKTALRHAEGARAEPTRPNLSTGGFEINFALRRVSVRGAEVKLTPTEYDLLQELATNANKVLTHRMLLHKVWGEEYSAENEYLRVFMNRLRKKLEQDPENPRHLQTVTGVGYYFAMAE